MDVRYHTDIQTQIQVIHINLKLNKRERTSKNPIKNEKSATHYASA